MRVAFPPAPRASFPRGGHTGQDRDSRSPGPRRLPDSFGRGNPTKPPTPPATTPRPPRKFQRGPRSPGPLLRSPLSRRGAEETRPARPHPSSPRSPHRKYLAGGRGGAGPAPPPSPSAAPQPLGGARPGPPRPPQPRTDLTGGRGRRSGLQRGLPPPPPPPPTLRSPARPSPRATAGQRAEESEMRGGGKHRPLFPFPRKF